MSLLKNLQEVLKNQDLTLHIAGKDDNLIVTILPKPKVTDEYSKILPPIILKGKAEEIEECIEKELLKELQEVNDNVTSINEFIKAKKDFKPKSDDKKTSTTKEAVKPIDPNEEKFKKIREYIDKKEYDKAEFMVKELLKTDKDNATALKLKEEVEKFIPKQVDMFDIIEESNTTIDNNSKNEVVEDDSNTDTCEEDNCQQIIEEEFDDEEGVNNALTNFEISTPTKDDYDPMMEEMEFWARREFDNQNH